MGVRHVVLLTWKDEATEEQKKTAIEAVLGLSGLVPGMGRYTAGLDLGIAGNQDAAIVVDFDDADACRAYMSHPTHQAVAKEHLVPIMAGSLRTQIAI